MNGRESAQPRRQDCTIRSKRRSLHLRSGYSGNSKPIYRSRNAVPPIHDTHTHIHMHTHMHTHLFLQLASPSLRHVRTGPLICSRDKLQYSRGRAFGLRVFSRRIIVVARFYILQNRGAASRGNSHAK